MAARKKTSRKPATRKPTTRRVRLTKAGKPDKRFVRKVSAPSKATKRAPSKRAVKRRKKPSVSGYSANPTGFLVFIRKGNGPKYYLQKRGKKYVWDTVVPHTMSQSAVDVIGKIEGKKALSKLPPGFAVYTEKK